MTQRHDGSYGVRLDATDGTVWWETRSATMAKHVRRVVQAWTGYRDERTLRRLAEFAMARPGCWTRSILAEFQNGGD